MLYSGGFWLRRATILISMTSFAVKISKS
jgi:hypothetical protein